MDKYELREGETFIEEFIDDTGTHITVIEDENGITMHGWVLEISETLEKYLKMAATDANMDVQDFIEMIVTEAIEKAAELEENRKFIEEISE